MSAREWVVRVGGAAPPVLTAASQYSFLLPLRYYACLCGHEELVLYLLANGEGRGQEYHPPVCVCVCTYVSSRALEHVNTFANTLKSSLSPLHPVSKYC